MTETATPKLYAARDVFDPQLAARRLRHLAAMTAEGLESKGDIADELAHRDLEIERLRAALAQATKWRPIESAPTDGTEVLVAFEHPCGPCVTVAHNRDVDNTGWCEGGDDDSGPLHGDSAPYAWQPLPEAPASPPGEGA